MRSQLAILSGILGIVLEGGLLTASALPQDRPNVIIVLVDDMGYADVGFNGCRDIPTPHIDSIAHSGVICTNGYVSHSFCSPTRAGLMTGRYQHRFGHENNPSFEPFDETIGLPVTETTIADVMSRAGYVTGMIGKWHLGASEPFHPLNRGFSEMYGFLGGGHQYFAEKLTVSEPREHKDQYNTKLLRNRTRVDEDEYLTDAFSREAADFVRRHREETFFLYLAYNAPHTPLQATEKYLKRFSGIQDEKRRTYAAMVSAVDDGVGLLLEALKKHGLEENTLIFFLSDNGGPISVNASRNDPLKGAKGQVFEGGIRVPFAIRWPRQIRAGGTFSKPVSSLDIFPTAAALAGVSSPPGKKLDGVNLIPYLTGASEGLPHERLFWRSGGGTAWAIRAGDSKLLLQGGKTPQLFNLAGDIGEERDLSSQQIQLGKELHSSFEKWNGEMIQPRWEGPQRPRPTQKK